MISILSNPNRITLLDGRPESNYFSLKCSWKKPLKLKYVPKYAVLLPFVKGFINLLRLQKRDPVRKAAVAPVFDLKNKKENDGNTSPVLSQSNQKVSDVVSHFHCLNLELRVVFVSGSQKYQFRVHGGTASTRYGLEFWRKRIFSIMAEWLR